jgi:hypothetical protein
MLARIVWIGVVVLNLALFASSISAFMAILQSGCTTATCHALIPPYSVKLSIRLLIISFRTRLWTNPGLSLFYSRACW